MPLCWNLKEQSDANCQKFLVRPVHCTDKEVKTGLTAFTPDSCCPIFMTMMETSCQRRERWESRDSTDKRPSILSDWSSRRISKSSWVTSSLPRRLCNAKGRWTLNPCHVKLTSHSQITFLCRDLITPLDERVPRAFWEERQQHELYHGRNAGNAQQEGPTWTNTGRNQVSFDSGYFQISFSSCILL